MRSLVISENIIHIWFVHLPSLGQVKLDMEQVLRPEELIRFTQFKFDKLRQRYFKNRLVLKSLISSYTGKHINKIQFDYNDYGKPFLRESPLNFNMSHSGEYTMIAFTFAGMIGVDIEKIDPHINILKLARRYFSSQESNYILMSDPELRPLLFFDCWSLKEAFIKAHGKGLNLPLGDFTMNLEQNRSPRLESIKYEEDITKWHVFRIPYLPDFKCAVVVRTEKNKNLTVRIDEFKFPVPGF